MAPLKDAGKAVETAVAVEQVGAKVVETGDLKGAAQAAAGATDIGVVKDIGGGAATAMAVGEASKAAADSGDIKGTLDIAQQGAQASNLDALKTSGVVTKTGLDVVTTGEKLTGSTATATEALGTKLTGTGEGAAGSATDAAKKLADTVKPGGEGGSDGGSGTT